MNPNFNHTNNLTESAYYYGVVESTSDASGLHRVKVRIIGTHSDDRKMLPTADLPWALVANSTNSNGKHTLKPGNFVVCVFLDIDRQQPMVMFSLLSKIKTKGVVLNSIKDAQNPGAIFINYSAPPSPSTTTDQTIYTTNIPAETIAKSQDGANIGNPFGKNTQPPLANGKNGGTGMFDDIEREIISLGNIFKHVVLYDTDDITLSADIDSEIGIIPLSRVTNIPKSGIIKIGDEIITYSGIADTGLSGQIMRGSPDRNSIIPTKKAEHKAGDLVTWIYPKVKNDKAPLFYSQLTGQAIDFAKEIKKRMSVVNGYITWLVNKISSQITSTLSGLIAQITLVLKTPTALVGKIIVDALLLVLSQVLCSFDKATVDSLVLSIEQYITEQVTTIIRSFYDNATAIQQFINNCTNKVFDAVLQFVSIIQSIGNLITNITRLFSGASEESIKVIDTNSGADNLNKVNGISFPDLTNTANIIAKLLNFLGLGCKQEVGENIVTPECRTDGYFPPANLCDPNPDTINELNALWRPLPQFITNYDFGGSLKVEYDNTPGSERTLLSSPAGTYTETFNDGTSRTVITKDSYTLILNDNNIEIKGNCNWKVDGNFGLKVSGNLDLEVGKELRMSIGGSSKITYGGSHTTNYGGDSVINATNKLNITGSQIGLVASGVVDIKGGVFDVLTSEINLTSSGSLNLISLHSNFVSGASHKEIHSGTVDQLVVGSQKKINLSNYTGDVVGNQQMNFMSTKTTNVAGINTVTNNSLYNVSSNIKTEKVDQLSTFNAKVLQINSDNKIETINGSSLNYSKGIALRSTQGINMDM
jgi:hypothetical protein